MKDESYFRGLKEGIRRFAWWKDGVQYVGTTGTSLKEALEDIDREEILHKGTSTQREDSKCQER